MSEYSNYRKPASHGGSYYSSREYLKDNLRVLKRNLLFCSGLPLTLTEDELKSPQYFGKYGTVLKVTLLKNIRQMSVYVTYADPAEASLAIIATNDFQIDRYHKLASIYGTIKYCKYFLKKIECKNLPNCNYLHVYDKKNEIYINNQLPDQVFDEHYNIALDLLKQVDVQKIIKEKRIIPNSDKNGDVFPCPIKALKKIKQEPYLFMEGQDESHHCNNRSHCGDENIEEGQQLSASEEARSQKSGSEKQTHQTVSSQTKQQGNHSQQFPKIETIIHSDKKQKPREGILRGCINSQESQQSMEIRLIRRILRESRSKLGLWTEGRRDNEQPVDLFHKGLDELNELRFICEWEVMQQTSQEEQRVKFLMIKKIHHSPCLSHQQNLSQQNHSQRASPSEKRKLQYYKGDRHYQ